MTKQKILNELKDINAMYNNCMMFEILEKHLDELILEAYKAGFRHGLDHLSFLINDGRKFTDDLIDDLVGYVEYTIPYNKFIEEENKNETV